MPKHKKNNEEIFENKKSTNIPIESCENQSIISDLKEKIKDLEKRLSDQNDVFLRMAAEYDNYRKRTERDRLNVYKDAVADTILPILSIADTIDRAANAEVGNEKKLKKGFELINKQLKDVLEKLEIKGFGSVGDKFDPDIHNAIAHIEDASQKANCLAEVFQIGYRMNDKIIRHAMVKVVN
ncbi:MAG: nucleotide exchange factor GrpE [Oscillospiraceae bacterium]|nr:nucleotide exchange factor GrpE [Oscillospiraceae bacterium]